MKKLRWGVLSTAKIGLEKVNYIQFKTKNIPMGKKNTNIGI